MGVKSPAMTPFDGSCLSGDPGAGGAPSSGCVPGIASTAQVHPAAVVGDGAVIEGGATVGPHCVVGSRARVGPGCVLGPRVQLAPGAVLEGRCTLDAGAVIGDPEGPAGAGERPPVRLGEGCHVGEYTVVRGTPDQPTCVDTGAFIMARCLIGSGARIGRQVVVTNNSVVGPGARVGDFSVLGGFSVVAAGVELGRRVMVGGLSWVAEDVPPFVLVHGLPARPFDINRVGLRRSGCPPPVREALHRALRLLLLGPADPQAVWRQLEVESSAFEEVRELVEFVARRPQLLTSWRRQPAQPHAQGKGTGDAAVDGE